MSAIKIFCLAIPVALALGGCGSGSSSSTSSTASSPTTSAQSQASNPATTPASTQSASTGGQTTAQQTSTAKSSPEPAAASPSHKVKPEDQLGKTPFLAATGQAFAAFHEYVAKPVRKHKLTQSGGSKTTIAKAATAVAYAAQELQAAATGAAASSSLSALVGPLNTLRQNLAAIAASLRAGHVDVSAIDTARTEVTTISVKALEAGQPIQEVLPNLP